MSRIWNEISEKIMAQPETVALSDSKNLQPLTYRKLRSRVATLVEQFSNLGITSFGLLADNGSGWIVCDLAAQAGDLVCVPLPGFFSRTQLAHILDDAGLRYLVRDSSLKIDISGFSHIADVPDIPGFEILERSTSTTSKTLPSDTCKITYTSGSTGNPKGVCLGADQVWRTARSLVEWTSDLGVEKHLCILPLATLLENIAGVYVPLLSGAEVVTIALEELGFTGSSRFDPDRLLLGIGAVQPGSLILTPQLLDVLTQACERGWKPPPSLKFIAVGGGKVSNSLLERAARSELPVYQGYGLSECASVISLNRPGHNRPGSVGKPLPHVHVKIVDGEIMVGGQAFPGYLGDVRTHSRDYFATGDLGSLDNDGYLYIDGRKKNLIVTSYGRNISPEWLESELLALPGVLQCVVFGESRPHCIALLVVDPEFSDAKICSQIAELNEGLPDYARIGDWIRLAEPFSVARQTLTSNGKPRRDEIARRHESQIESLYGPAEAAQAAHPSLRPGA